MVTFMVNVFMVIHGDEWLIFIVMPLDFQWGLWIMKNSDEWDVFVFPMGSIDGDFLSTFHSPKNYSFVG